MNYLEPHTHRTNKKINDIKNVALNNKHNEERKVSNKNSFSTHFDSYQIPDEREEETARIREALCEAIEEN
jgi:hypothetical protein